MSTRRNEGGTQVHQYRQGDVFIERISEDQVAMDGATVVPRDHGRVILAYGEVTGHSHAIDSRAATLYAVPGQDDRVLVINGEGAMPGVLLEHEEHGTITLPPGTYRVRHQREYAPGEIRRVAD